MSDCCTPKGYRQIFSEKNAAGEAKRYRRKGLDGTSKRIFDFIREQIGAPVSPTRPEATAVESQLVLIPS